MKVLAIVPARCGSKGFPHKNIAKIQEKTLLELAVSVAVDTTSIDDIYISTDCRQYEELAVNKGAKSLGLRSKHLASDTAKSVDVVIDLLERLDEEYTYLVLLQPTSPIREPQDIENMISMLEKTNMDACVSISLVDEPHPHKLKLINQNGFVEPFIEGATSEVARQLLPAVYALNGALYVIKLKALFQDKSFLPKKTIPYKMKNNINIDSEEDFIFFEAMVNKNKVSVWGLDDKEC